MKSIKEILVTLARELIKHVDKIKSIDPTSLYHNDILGDTSFLLAGLLDSLLKQNNSEWDDRKWIDDSLVTNVNIQNNRLMIEGVMIWGKMNTTEQWTDPFSFEIELLENDIGFKDFNFRFCDLDNPEITYEDFRNHRDYWTPMDRSGSMFSTQMKLLFKCR